MGKSAPSAPAAPDPAATAAAQTQSNQQTALYNFGLNNPNYYTPLGSLTYTQTNGMPTVNQSAYDAAMAAWQAQGGSGSGGSPLSYQNWLSQGTNNNLSNNQRNDAYNQYVQNFSGSSGSHGAMPNISDYTTPGGNPQFTANVKLSPEQQQLYDLQTSQSIDLSKLASALQGRVGDSLNQPMTTQADINKLSQQAQDAYYAQQTHFLDPQYEQAQNSLNASLANQGITQGSEAYNNAVNNFGRQKQSAYDTAQQNAILSGPQNAQQLFALSTEARDQPLNEFNALRSQSQVQMPQFQGTNTSQAAPTNTAQIAQNAYQGQMNSYNQQQAAQNSLYSNLFGLGGSLGAAAIFSSDSRLKENIEYLGNEKGHRIYKFNYIGDTDKVPYRGVIAQQVRDIDPAAVVKIGKYYAVDYSRIGIEFGKVH